MAMTLTPMEQFEVKPLAGMDHPLFQIALSFQAPRPLFAFGSQIWAVPVLPPTE